MRAYVRRGHAGVSAGCLGTLVIGCVMAVVIAAAAELALIAGAVVLVVAVVTRASRARRQKRPGLRLYHAPRLPDNRRQWVERERWPHAVPAGSWLARH